MKPLPLLLFLLLSLSNVSSNPVLRLDWQQTPEDLQEVGIVYTINGPTSPEYPDFKKENKARRFDGSSRFVLNDQGEKSELDFTNGDTITLEAWVAPTTVRDGDNVYIIGKGRTGNSGFAANNQNYALRLRGQNGMGCASFLFYSQPTKEHKGDWHRWTTNTGVIPEDGWGHVAVTYEFGKPDSIRGYVNGEDVAGRWDMGGATTLPPVVDNDQLWIGAALGGSIRSSFVGGMDNVALHREALSPETLKKRYQRNRAENALTEFQRENWPTDVVAVEVVEGVNIALGWPGNDHPVVSTYQQDELAFFRAPSKYSEQGIKMDHPRTFLLRALTTLELPEGKHDWLLRYRWATKLWIDGQLVLNLPQTPKKGGAHGSVPKIPEDWPEYLRIPSPGDVERRFSVISEGKPVKVRLEILVGDQHGKKKYRHDLGETCLAVAVNDAKYHVMGPNSSFPLTDHAWLAWRRNQELQLQDVDTQLRREAAVMAKSNWKLRHQKAREIVQNQSGPKPPEIPSFLPKNNAIDQFIGQELLIASGNHDHSSNKASRLFTNEVFPMLKENCIKCHHGKKAKGGLHLDSLEGMLKGGDSGEPALVPGDLDKSLMFALVSSSDQDEIMPPKGDPLNARETRALREWIELGATWPDEKTEVPSLNTAKVTKSDVEKAGLSPTPLTDDLSFLRRVTLDTIGVFPSAEQIRGFQADQSPDKRAKFIDRLLEHPGWAHHWVGYWQDVLAENPNILKPRLNNTGPFRDWIFESFLDNKSLDQFATELIMMEGSKLGGGPAGFAIATQNDAPLAAKAHVLSTAFMGTNLQCARCHDSPYHPYKQKDLFGIAAMLNRKPLSVPSTSRAKLPDIGDRKPLIEVTLKPGESVPPVWGFQDIVDPEIADLSSKAIPDSRKRLAEILTSPHNLRFAQVMVNRVWARYFGVGFVASHDDWHNLEPSHPELLNYLARYLVLNNYDLKALSRLILNSHAYQRESAPALAETTKPYFHTQTKRRLTAEQIVDGLFQVTDIPMEVGELNMDRDGSSGPDTFLNLGHPRRSWQLISLSNERDRPSLAFPRIQAVIDTLKQFGWRPSRQEPLTERDASVHALQPGILANGVLTTWFTRLSNQHGFTELSVQSSSPDELVREAFRRFLTREPTKDELMHFSDFLSPGFEERVIPFEDRQPIPYPKKIPTVSWSNHLSPEANSIMIALEKRARDGDPPTNALQPEWREKMEDFIWAMINSPELMFVP